MPFERSLAVSDEPAMPLKKPEKNMLRMIATA